MSSNNLTIFLEYEEIQWNEITKLIASDIPSIWTFFPPLA